MSIGFRQIPSSLTPVPAFATPSGSVLPLLRLKLSAWNQDRTPKARFAAERDAEIRPPDLTTSHRESGSVDSPTPHP